MPPRRLWAGALLAAASALAATSACKSETDDGGLAAGSSSGGRAGSSSVPLGGTSTGGTSGGAGEGAMPGGTPCEELAGLEACGGTKVEAQLNTINVLLVIDKSGSMTDTPDGFDSDKWSALTRALRTALGDVNERVRLGLVLYPALAGGTIPLDNCGDLCCEMPDGQAAVQVEIGGADVSVPAIIAELEATTPGGGTPTAAALERAYEYYTSGAGAELDGSRFVLLATDGGPNCNFDNSCDADRCTPYLDGDCTEDYCCDDAGEFCLDDAAVTAQIEALAGAGISTFVVGIPGTEDYSDYLDGFARAGGVPASGADTDYFAVSAEGGVEGLVDVFTDITTDLVTSCDIELTEQPARLDAVNVAVDCQVVPKESDDGSGWEYDQTPDPRYVVLEGPICERLRETGASRIDIVFGCPTVR